MKKFNKNNAELNIKMRQNKNTYIKRLSISLACLILVCVIVLFTFAKFETSSEEYTLINGVVKNNICNIEIGHEWTFDYTGNYQTFKTECEGYYQVELWGAQGGNCRGSGGGYGAYTAGTIRLNENQQLYIYVGQVGSNSNTLDIAVRFNGGGGVSGTTGRASGPTGGGATDIRIENGAWNNATSLRSRLMVSAGGGGCIFGGPGGGLTGYNSTSTSYVAYSGKGGTQTAGGAAPSRYSACASGSGGCHQGTAGAFGQGGTGGRNSEETTSTGVVADGGGGGGSGYYGGSGASGLYNSGGMSGGGGSSYISGHTGCVAITSSSSQTPKSGCTTGTTDNNCSKHYSNFYFTNTRMIDGNGYEWTATKDSTVTGMPTHDGTSTMNGNSGNGYAKITLISYN